MSNPAFQEHQLVSGSQKDLATTVHANVGFAYQHLKTTFFLGFGLEMHWHAPDKACPAKAYQVAFLNITNTHEKYISEIFCLCVRGVYVEKQVKRPTA